MSSEKSNLSEQILKVKLKSIYDLNDDHSNLDDILEQYRLLAKGSKKLLDLKGKDLLTAQREQATHFQFYDEARINLKTIMDYYESLVKHVRGVTYKKIVSSSSKDLPDRAINSQIDADPNYIGEYRTYLTIREVYEKFQSIIDSYKQRGYSLNNIVRAIEHSFQDTIL